MKQKNDSPRSGTHRVVVKKYLEKLGWQWTPTMFIGQGCKVHLKKDELPSGTFFVWPLLILRGFIHVVKLVEHKVKVCRAPKHDSSTLSGRLI